MEDRLKKIERTLELLIERVGILTDMIQCSNERAELTHKALHDAIDLLNEPEEYEEDKEDSPVDQPTPSFTTTTTTSSTHPLILVCATCGGSGRVGLLNGGPGQCPACAGIGVGNVHL